MSGDFDALVGVTFDNPFGGLSQSDYINFKGEFVDLKREHFGTFSEIMRGGRSPMRAIGDLSSRLATGEAIKQVITNGIFSYIDSKIDQHFMNKAVDEGIEYLSDNVSNAGQNTVFNMTTEAFFELVIDQWPEMNENDISAELYGIAPNGMDAWSDAISGCLEEVIQPIIDDWQDAQDELEFAGYFIG